MARNHRAGRKLVSVKVRSILGSSYGDVSRDHFFVAWWLLLHEDHRSVWYFPVVNHSGGDWVELSILARFYRLYRPPLAVRVISICDI